MASEQSAGAVQPQQKEEPSFLRKAAGWMRSMMLTYEDVGRVQVISQNLEEDEVYLVGAKPATQAIEGTPVGRGDLSAREESTVGNV